MRKPPLRRPLPQKQRCGAQRRRGLGPLTMPARSNCIVPAFYYRAPVDDPDQWDEISLRIGRSRARRRRRGVLMLLLCLSGGLVVAAPTVIATGAGIAGRGRGSGETRPVVVGIIMLVTKSVELI